MQKLNLIGGGLVGSLSAIYLAQHGFEVEVFERRGDMRKLSMAAGRSINLALTSRGIRALEQVRLKEEVMQLCIPVRGRMLHDVEGNTKLVPYSQNPEEYINSISRGDLNKLLLTKAESYRNVKINFEHTTTDFDKNTVTIATDGAWSAIRKVMLESVQNFDYSQSFCEAGYKELTLPAAPDGSYKIEKNALHIWPRGRFMLMALPNQGGSFTLTLFLDHHGEESFETLQATPQVDAFFTKYFPDVKAMLPELTEQFLANPTGSMVTVKCAPWHIGGQAMLLGDAAHAIVPFFGQGMNCGFEDAYALNALLEKHGSNPDWEKLFVELQAQRKPNADAIADLALENFIEMRDTVANPKFQLKKQIGFELEKRFPKKFIPRYSMVVFHPEIPYADARRLGQEQEKMLDILAEGITSVEQVDWAKAAEMVG